MGVVRGPPKAVDASNGRLCDACGKSKVLATAGGERLLGAVRLGEALSLLEGELTQNEQTGDGDDGFVWSF